VDGEVGGGDRGPCRLTQITGQGRVGECELVDQLQRLVELDGLGLGRKNQPGAVRHQSESRSADLVGVAGCLSIRVFRVLDDSPHQAAVDVVPPARPRFPTLRVGHTIP
jgi:hypothetical protein